MAQKLESKINYNISYNELKKRLLNNDLTIKEKKEIEKYLKLKQKNMDKNWKEFISFFSVEKNNEVFDLAKSQLFREGSSMVVSKGIPPRHQLYLNEDYYIGKILGEIIDGMKKIEGVYFTMQARPNYGKTIEEIDEALLTEKERKYESIIRNKNRRI